MSKIYFVNALNTGEEITDYFMAKGASIKTGSNHKDYFDVTLCDKTGDVSSKKWDVSDEESGALSKLKDGDIVKVKAIVSEWNGIKQLKIAKIRKISENDMVEMADFVKAAPENPVEMYNYIYERSNEIIDEGLRKVCQNALEENKERLLYYPAAKSNHHAELGGLLYHMRRMLTMGILACKVYTDLDADWVICGVIMHDMEKLNEIESNEYGISSGYSAKGNMLGHLVMGAISMEERAKAVGLSEEKTMMLQHMIVAHHNEPEFGSPVRPMFAEAELLHHLDMIDARMFDFEAALEATEPGHFSERIRQLDGRMLYKPSFEKLHCEKTSK